MITVDALGKTCPIPVVMTKKAMADAAAGDVVKVLVDNEIAVENLGKMAGQMGYTFVSAQVSETEYHVEIIVGEKKASAGEASGDAAFLSCDSQGAPQAKNVVVAVGSAGMGEGSEALGKILIKGFLFALTQQEQLPKTVLFYNGGASLTCEGSESIADLQKLQEEGVEILTCGTCLNHYGLADKLQVGEVTNMYVIAEKLTKASHVIKP